MKKQETQTHDQRDMFTGGDWFVDKGDFNRTKDPSCIYVRSLVTSPGADSEDMKEHFDICNFSCDETEQAEANAALIAEAPAMYKALKALVKVVTMTDSAFHPANVNAKAILNKIK